MKKVKLTLLILISGIMACGQGPGRPEGADRGRDRIAKLDSIVQLTDEQKAKIEHIQSEYREKMRAERVSNASPDKEKMQQMRMEMERKIKGVLTDEQLELMKEAKDERKLVMKQMNQELKSYREANIQPTLARLHQSLTDELSPEEKNKIDLVKQRLEEMKKEFKASNPPADSKQKQPKSMTIEQRDQIHNMAMDELKPILDSHKSTLDRIMADLTPLQSTWKADMEAIQKKYGVDAGKQREGKRPDGKGKYKKDRKKADTGAVEDWKKIRFILGGDDASRMEH